MTVSSTRPTGRTLFCKGGYQAFLPDPLPPELDWDLELVHLLSRADLAVGRLAGEGRRLPNPHILIRPFVRREAVLSSRIEGTRSSLGQVLQAEAGISVEQSPEDLREVRNYVTALEYGLERLHDLPLSLRLTRELHARLMEGVRGGHATPGEFRRSQNWIGAPGSTLATASYVPPPPEELPQALGDWETFLHDRSLPALVHAALIHYQFEAIHPFLDGNGRVGRLLITLLLVDRDVLPLPLLYLSAYLEASRQDYYDCLTTVRNDGDWEGWLRYFLVGVERQALDAAKRAERINALLDQWRKLASEKGTATAIRLVDLLGENPYWNISTAADRLGVAFATSDKAMQHLAGLGIVGQINDARRFRVYCAERMLHVMELDSALEE